MVVLGCIMTQKILKSAFLAIKKLIQVVNSVGGEGACRGILDTFIMKPSLNPKACFIWTLIISHYQFLKTAILNIEMDTSTMTE